jgi:hypothetical protein
MTEPPGLGLHPSFPHTHTCGCSLKLGNTFENSEASECLSCDLTHPNGNRVEAVRLDQPLDSYFDEEGSDCSLIELSFGSVHSQATEGVSFDEWNRPDCPRKDGVYEFYDVLWVKKIGGVSYRKALGRVVKSIWEECSVEVDLTLG